jgi:hypothetical protein
MRKKHIVLPDGQVKPGVPLEHWGYAGEYVAEKKPDVVVNLGDMADMPSLSSYDEGKKSYEGRTYQADVEVCKLLSSYSLNLSKPKLSDLKEIRKELGILDSFLHWATMKIESNEQLNSTENSKEPLESSDLKYEEFGWEVIPYREPIIIDGIAYCHFFSSGEMGSSCNISQSPLN